MYTIYCIYNKERNKLYIGQTEDIEARLLLHNNKGFKKSYTAKLGGEWKLIYSEVAPERKTALAREKQLRSFRGRESLKQYIPK